MEAVTASDSRKTQVAPSQLLTVCRLEPFKLQSFDTQTLSNTASTFENILTTDQIEKIFYGLRNFNNGGRFEVIVKEELPDYIYQFDILHFVWNVTKRVYDKKHSKYKFRDRAAEFAKSSFPLIVTSALESIGSTMSNVDNRTFSLPKIKPGKPLIPHDFNEVKQRKEAKNVA